MVAAVMEPSMRDTKQWMGVVGAKLGTNLYVDLTATHTEKSFEDGVQRLAKEIRDRAGGARPQSVLQRLKTRSIINPPNGPTAPLDAEQPDKQVPL